MLRQIFFAIVFIFLKKVSAQITIDTISEQEGKASFYHDSFQGSETSNGENYDKDDFTAAHRTIPFNTYLLVKNKTNNKSVVVRVNDRGPFRKSRVIDLTKSAAKKIGMVPFGVVPVKIDKLTYLDLLQMSDSQFVENDVWDCYANKIKLNDKNIFIWKTESWKHAFYMASILTLENKERTIVVKIIGRNSWRMYSILITGIKKQTDALNLVSTFHKLGFIHSKIIEASHN